MISNEGIKFVCPKCLKALISKQAELFCRHCNLSYDKRDGKFYFVECAEGAVKDPLDKFKYILKRYTFVYNLAIKILSPVMPSGSLGRFLRKYGRKRGVCLNLGSGNTRIADHFINVDLFDYFNVDVVCDVTQLPFKSNSVDVVTNVALLEHVPDPKLVIDEIKRVLKPKGLSYCYFPFIQGFHASPYDFTRFTKEGLRALFSDFKIVSLKPAAGPTSGMLWIFQEWLALVLSFGIRPLHRVIYIIVMFLTFPIKIIDILLIKHPSAENIASAFVVVAKKI